MRKPHLHGFWLWLQRDGMRMDGGTRSERMEKGGWNKDAMHINDNTFEECENDGHLETQRWEAEGRKDGARANVKKQMAAALR